MAIYVGTTPNLIQGVSEQEPKERVPGQLESQQDMMSHPVQGLSRRTGTELLNFLFMYSPGSFYYTYIRGSDEHYTIAITPIGFVYVIDKDGALVTVSQGNAAQQAYLQASDGLTAVTVGDLTLVANTKVAVEVLPDLSPALNTGVASGLQHYVWFTGVEYGRVYKVFANGVLLSTYTTPSTITLATDEQQAAATLDPTIAIEAIRSGWVAATGYSISVRHDKASVIITEDANTGNIIDLIVEGGSELHVVANQNIQTLADIPPISSNGVVLKVDNSAKIDEDNYYLRYESAITATPNSKGRWVESIAPQIKHKLDWLTMPVAIIQKVAAGPFFVEYPNQAEGTPYWDERTVGDDKTNKIPSFVGKKILSMGAFQTRLFFEAEDSFVCSKTDNYFSFWKHTALTDRDDDRIDVIAPSATVNILKAHVLYNKNLVLFSEGTQYIQSGDQPLTPRTINLGVSTSYDMDLSCLPEATGDAILFCTRSGEFTKIQSFRLEDLTNLERATSLTDHVPKYIPKGVEQIAASSALNTAFFRIADSSDIYVHQWHIQDNSYLQQAWHKWTLKWHTPLHMFLIENKLMILAKRTDSDDIDLLSVDVTTQDTAGYDSALHLDNWQYFPKEDWVAVDDTYQLTINIDIADDLVCVRAASADSPGMLVATTKTGLVLETTAFRDSGPQDCFVGSNYQSSAKLTAPYVRNTEGEAITDASIDIEEMTLNVRSSGSMIATLEYPYNDTLDIPVNAPVVGIFLIGKWSVFTGAVPVPIFGLNDELDMTMKSNAHLPMTIVDLSWRGTYRQRGKWI